MRLDEAKPESDTAIRRRSCLTAILVLGLLIAFFAAFFALITWPVVTTAATSPDGALRAEIVDRRLHFSDRNFRLRIVDAKGQAKVVFRSPDESPGGTGQERLLWSSDGRRLLLIGRRFWVRGEAKLESGESLYLLYDVPSGRVWCNADVEGTPFGEQELAGYDFGEELVRQ